VALSGCDEPGAGTKTGAGAGAVVASVKAVQRDIAAHAGIHQ
jgi:hypothetical protein